MGLKFHRSFSILPGVRLNFSKSGIEISLGAKGNRVSFGPAGIRRTISMPGTGVSHIDRLYSVPKTKIKEQNSDDSIGLSSIFSSSNVLPLVVLGFLGLGLIGGVSFLFSLFANVVSHPQPKVNVENIVSTSFALYTQEALVNQIFGEYTQTAVKAQLSFGQTQTVQNFPLATITQLATLTLKPPDVTCSPTIEPIPILPPIQNTVMPVQPLENYSSIYILPTIELAPSGYCCKICSKGKACGNSCISRKYTCHQPPGCACDSY